jgi:hypothetical protein
VIKIVTRTIDGKTTIRLQNLYKYVTFLVISYTPPCVHLSGKMPITKPVLPMLTNNGKNRCDEKYLENLAFNRIQAIRDSEVRATVFFTRKIHALNTLKMAPVLRSNVMQS